MSSTNPHNLKSKEKGDLGAFIDTLYDNSAPDGLSDIRLNVRELRFNAKYDTLVNSGIVWKILGPCKLKEEDAVGSVGEKLMAPNRGRESAAVNLMSARLTHGSWENIPLSEWLSIVVDLFFHCKNVEVIEIPSSWRFDFRWRDCDFPKVDRGSSQLVGKGSRVRWVSKSKVEAEVTEGKTMGQDRGREERSTAGPEQAVMF
ncbi:hypothetical protein CC80DRAFT_595562 [Byssothecium circinans]|uniref:Uncharacterized protein n=1 Tax=Byssothecium circinans TaxID=147558 RepID=A0A6A5TNN9_9PLEO|nr:hypothetical protein CC80DRAFT_595562 [Byssothecium circinans]